MKNFFHRFPDVCHDIFDQLDDQNLAKSKEVSVIWCRFINSERFWWIRMIQNYADEDITEDPDVWRKVVVRNPIEIVKNLAISSRQFYKCCPRARDISPFHIMAHSGDLQILKKFKLKDQKCKEGFSLLHYATMGGYIESCKYLMSNLKENNPASNDGFTPLYIAAQNGRYDICKLIVGNVDEKNPAINGGCTPLSVAASNGHIDICKLIIGNVDNKNPANNQGNTPLHKAAQNNHFDICKYIIDNVDNKNPANNRGYTPLHIAAHNGHFDNCKLIIENVDDKNPANIIGITPLHLAAHTGHFEICKLIIDNVYNTHRRMFTSQSGFEKYYMVLQYLHPIDDNGYTPLLLAAQRNYFGTYKIIYYLLCKFTKIMYE